MRRMLAVALGVTLAVSTLRAQAPAGGPGQDGNVMEKLAAANNLELKGNSAFYLSATFQLFDMEGKPKETGSFEKWWAAPGSMRYVVHLPGLNEDGSAPADATLALQRDAYLIGVLSQAMVQPVAPRQWLGDTVTEQTRTVGKTSLRCLTKKLDLLAGQQPATETYCTDASLNDVRLVTGSDGNMSMLRNSVGKFHETYVSLVPLIAYFGRDAISAKVTALHSFAPAKGEVQLPPAESEGASPGAGPAKGGVVAGKRIGFVEPRYPAGAVMARLNGSVLLHAVIGKDGSIRSLVPIASTSFVFDDAAKTAVQQWKYSPYLLNGAPTEIDTLITINFQTGH